MAKIVVLQHHPAEALGNIAGALEGCALAWQYVRIFDGHPVPRDMKGAGGLIVMGGPMGVYQHERYPFIRDELKLIESAAAAKLPVLGVCLGAQMVAAALGAKVEKNPAGKEIGWYPVQTSPAARDDRLFRGVADTITPFHWHGDTFELPRDAVALASSERTPCQGFRYADNVYALQFHIEVTRDGIAAMADAFARELEREKIDGASMVNLWDEYGAELERLADTVFTRWAAPIEGT